MQIQTEIIINAPAANIWSILTDLERYSKWNPFMVESHGQIVEGEKLKNTMRNGEKLMTFTPTVLKVEPGRYFEWLGSLYFRGLFDGKHYFELVPLSDNQTKLIHGEEFKGILVKLILKQIGDQTRDNFVAMNQALKEKAEKIPSSQE